MTNQTWRIPLKKMKPGFYIEHKTQACPIKIEDAVI